MTVLPVTYLGGIDFFTALIADDCVLDLGEKWVKQSVRNRCEIVTSRGVSALTVPVHSAQFTRDVRIDHSKRWQHVHWQSIVSAYRSAPFFDHFQERFVPVFGDRRYDFLLDLDLELLDIVLAILGLPMPKISAEYIVATSDDLDLRGKKSLRRTDRGTPYTQVFSDRLPFIPGVSIADLIFNEGPDAKDHLLRAIP